MSAQLSKQYSQESIVQLIGDIAIFYLSLWIAIVLRLWQPVSFETYLNLSKPYLLIFIVWLAIFVIEGLYERKVITSTHEIATDVIRAQLINGIIAIIFFYFLSNVNYTSRSILLLVALISMILIIIWRSTLHLYSKRKNKYPTLIFTASKAPKELEEALAEEKASHPFTLALSLEKKDSSGNEELFRQIKEHNVKFLIVDSQDKDFQEDFGSIAQLIFEDVEILDIRDVYEALFQCVPHTLFNYHWYINKVKSQGSAGYQALKRFIDLALSFITIIISLPLYPLIALAIKLEDFGPIFIKQKRIGKDGKEFNSYKFRTMKRNEDGVWISESDNEITKIGKFLRKTRLDELPQLFSVLTGQMSLIGPRPDIAGLEKRLSSEIDYYRLRTLVKPGISGWAVIKQAYIPQSVEETKHRLGYDLYYIKNQSTALDLKILLQTIKAILKGIWFKH